MNAWTAADHPRGDGGRFKTKTRTEPEGELEADRVVSTPTTSAHGVVQWWLNGEAHRRDGPAVIWPDGSEEWWVNGERHREDGPAVIYPTGFEAWLLHGQNHRTNGPAITWPDGRLEWWENDVRKPPEVEAALSMVWLARTPPGA